MTVKMTRNGFTLVELAIVLMIIGLLIGGILKGQELIKNARIVSFARQIEGYRGAALVFRDAYGVLPGDITNPSTRLPNCSTSPCNVAGDGNGLIGGTTSITAALYNPLDPATENGNFWTHMNNTNIISAGFNNTAADASIIAAIQAPLSGGLLTISYVSSAAVDNYPSLTGHYLLFKSPEGLLTNSYTYGTAGNFAVRPQDASRVDRKMDDGKPYAGDVLATGDTSCFSSLEYSGISSNVCNLLIKLF